MNTMNLNLEQKVDLLLEKVTSHDARFDCIDQRFEHIEGTLDAVAVEVVGLRGDVDGLTGRVNVLEEKVTDGFGRLDAFVHELQRHEVEIVANRSATRRHEDRLETLERAAA